MKSDRSKAHDGPPSTDAPGSAQEPVFKEVERLVAAGKCKQAVELAKEEHKRRKSPDTERLVVEAYLGRIDQFAKKGAVEDARTLIQLVRDRFPAHRDRLQSLEIRAAAVEGNIDSLVEPLLRPDLATEARSSIEAAIRLELTDLPALAKSSVLPLDHPLKIAAAAVWEAFSAATSGPVTDDQIALPQVSRQSPLAGWKLLVRAVAAYYRRDDEGCRRALGAIPKDAAVRKLAPVLIGLMDRTPPGPGLAGVLQARIGGSDESLRKAMAAFERAIPGRYIDDLLVAIRTTVASCSATHPHLLTKLMQHISVRCEIDEVPIADVLTVMPPALKSAYFWKLYARANNVNGAGGPAMIGWERFLKHAIAEKLIALGSLEESAVLLQITALFISAPRDGIAAMRKEYSGNLIAGFYRGQPPEVLALKPASDAEVLNFVIDPGKLFRRATEINPNPQTFKVWWKWANNANAGVATLESIARFWHEKLPKDPQPLIELSQLSEERSALKQAIDFLDQAEAIDRLDPRVRKARLRLTLTITWRHFKDSKPHLVEADLNALEAIPAMSEGDRAGVLAGLRAAWHALRDDAPAAQRARDSALERVGQLVAHPLLTAIAKRAGVASRPSWPIGPPVARPEPRAVAEAEARLRVLSDELQLPIEQPRGWKTIISKVLRNKKCPLAPSVLLALARGSKDPELVYLATIAGLAGASGAMAATFLLIRAKALPKWAEQRTAQCLRGAYHLAQQAHDAELMESISEAIDSHPASRRLLAATVGERLSPEDLKRMVDAERSARRLPSARVPDNHVVFDLVTLPLMHSAPFPFDAGPLDEDFADDDDDDDSDDDYDGFNLFGGVDARPEIDLPPDAETMLEQLRDKNGNLPSPAELAEMIREMATQFKFPKNDPLLKKVLDLLAKQPDPSKSDRDPRRRR